MTVRGLLVPGVVVFVAALIGAWLSAESRAQTPTPAPSPAASIAGAWTLNKDLSDQPQIGRQGDDGSGRDGYGRRGGMGGGFGRGGGMRGGGMGRGGFGGMNPEDMQRMRDAMREIMTPPGRLTIVQADAMIVITTGDGRVTRLSPDGKKIKDENTKVERRTKWDGTKLVSEVSGLGPGKITEAYAVDRERHQLVVTMTMDNPRASQPMTQRRVYDAESK